MHVRNLLVLAAAFAVAPLSAHEREDAVADQSETECPYQRAAAQSSPTVVTIETAAPEGSMLDAGRSSPAYLP